MALSKLPLNRRALSGLKARQRTQWLWPRSVARNAGAVVVHRRMVISALPLASNEPSGLKATAST